MNDRLDADALAAPRRPRGRPRKPPEARDEGNRRQALIHAAAALFRRQGFAGTSTRDIASAVGMQSGSPFYHFRDKGTLLYEVMAQGMHAALQQQADALAALPTNADAEAQLRVLIRAHFAVLHGPHSDFIPVMLYEWHALTPPRREAITALRRDYEARWQAPLDALHRRRRLNGDVALARLLLLGALNWTVQWYRPGGGVDLDALTGEALRLFVRDAAPPTPQE